MGTRARFWVVCAVIVAAIAGVAMPSGSRRTTQRQTTQANTATAAHTTSSASTRIAPTPIDPGALRLEGQVIDEHEQPIGGAKVTLAGTRVTTSEADGSFAFDDLASGQYALVAEGSDFYGEDDAHLDDTSDPVMLQVKRGPALVVHVVEASTGAPLAGATVKTSSRTSVTGGDGIAQLRGIDTPYEHFEVTATGHAGMQLSVSSGEDTTLIERTVVLGSGASVEGTVVDDYGAPVAEARVVIESAGDTWREDVTTDAAGVWRVPLLAAGKHGVHASSELHIATPDQVFELDGATPRTGIVVHVETGGQIAGTVVDELGRPVADAHVNTGNGAETTDANGRFTGSGIPEGKYEVYAVTSTGISPTTNVTLARGAHAEVRLALVTSSIAGKVVDSHGAPIDNAIVYASAKATHESHYSRSDHYGHFDLNGVPPGDYEIAAQRSVEVHRDLPPGVLVKSGNRNFTIVLPDVASISGRVVFTGGKPVPRFGFVVTATPETTLFDNLTSVRDGTGRFTQHDLSPGKWGIAIVGPGFTRKVVDSIDVTAGATIELGDIVVARGRSVSGRVVDERGAPVAGAMVAIYDRRFNADEDSLSQRLQGNFSARTDASGRYVIDGIPPTAARQRVEATHARGISRQRELGPDETTVDLVIASTGELAGTIADMAPRQHVAVATPVANDIADLTTYRADIDIGGAFVFDRLPPGEYNVRVSGHNTLPEMRVTVIANRRVSVAFAMSKTPITVVLHVAGDDCKILNLMPPDTTEQWLATESCENGRAEIPGVAPGRYRVAIDFDGGHDITVAATPERQTIELHKE